MHAILEVLENLSKNEIPQLSDYYPAQFSEDDVKDAFEELSETWQHPPQGGAFLDWIRQRFQVAHSTDLTQTKQLLNGPILVTVHLYRWMNALGHFETNSEEGLARKKEMMRIMRAQRHCYRALRVTQFACITCDPERDEMETEDADLNFSIISFEPDSERTPYQNLIWHLLQLFEQRKYRKHGEYVYEEIITEGEHHRGHRSFAWRQVQTILEFIYENVTKENDYGMWKHLTSTPHSARDCAAHIQNSGELELPTLQFNRKLFSFQNGLLHIDQLAFYPFGREDEWPEIAAAAVEKMRTWRPDFEGTCPCRGDVAINYIDLPFEHDVNAMDLDAADVSGIPTPEVDKILSDQQLEEDTKEWFFTMLGRCLYDVGEIDCWQVLMFLKGVAGSGKSTIAQLLKSIYPAHLVGVLSSNAEAKFGLAPLFDKKLIICPEVKEDFGISRGDLQSIISGEDVSVPRKHQDALTVNWRTPMLFCGNELPAWQDSQGSMKRRLLCFEFLWKVRGGDPLLKDRMMTNLQNFLLKINICYLKNCKLYRNRNLWDKQSNGEPILSRELHRFAEMMRITVDPLYYFIKESNVVRLDLDAFVPKGVFQDAFKQFCRNHDIKPPAFREDMYREVFNDLGIKVEAGTLSYNGETRPDVYIHGLDVVVMED